MALDYNKIDREFRRATQAVIVQMQNGLRHPLEKGVGPKQSGIYALFHQNRLKYVGSAKRTIRQRLKEHIQTLTGCANIDMADMTVTYIPFDSSKALYFEDELINRHNPEWNNSGFGNADPGRSKGISKWHMQYPKITTQQKDDTPELSN